MKYLFASLLLMGCCHASVVSAPPDGQHLPLTVECTNIDECSTLLEHVCHHNHYHIKSMRAVRKDNEDHYLVSAVCNP